MPSALLHSLRELGAAGAGGAARTNSRRVSEDQRVMLVEAEFTLAKQTGDDLKLHDGGYAS